MYPKFIELHTADDGEPCSVNVDNILMFYPDPDEKGSYISFPFTGTDSYQDVTESYEEVKKLIHDAGVFVQQTDPRLDVTHPLTMDDLKEMIGEPVWNSNTRDWWLIHWYLEEQTFDEIIVYNNKGVQECWDRKDLIKCPLYRMKP